MLSPVWFPCHPDGTGRSRRSSAAYRGPRRDADFDVTLFASGDSTTTARHVHVFDEAPSERIGETFWELNHALECLNRLDHFDLVHDHTGLLGLTLFGLSGAPLVHTVHGPLEGVPRDMYRASVRTRAAYRARLA